MHRITRSISILAVVAAPAMVACGSPGSFHGTVGGLTLNVKDSVFLAQKANGQVFTLTLLMTDKPGLCDALKAGNFLKDATYFAASLAEGSGGQVTTPTAGDFSLANPSTTSGKALMGVGLAKADASCHGSSSVSGASGQLKLNAYKAEAGGSMTGTFDIAFGPLAEHGTGDFDADFCDASLSISGCQ